MPLAPRVFLLGPNASGKSDVLDALRFLRGIRRTKACKPPSATGAADIRDLGGKHLSIKA